MKSSENNGSLRRAPHLLSLLVAVLAAVGMWYVVSVRDRLEAQVEVNIDYYGIPPNLVVTDGLISKITVRLRGPETLLRSIPQQRLTQAVDLSDIKKGVTVVPLGGDNLGPTFRAFELVDIQPPRIVIKADTLMERSVPLRTIVDSPLRGGALTVENVSVSPATVVLRGPEDVVSDISSVPLTIMLDPKAAALPCTRPSPWTRPVWSPPIRPRCACSTPSPAAVPWFRGAARWSWPGKTAASTRWNPRK